MKFIVTNQNKAERLVRLVVSIFLLLAPFIYQNNPFAIIQSIIGGILLFNAFSGMFIFYSFFGANTCKV